MSDQAFYIILSIVGVFCSLALVVNAYFIKEMLASLNQVKLQTAVLIEKSQNKEARLGKAEREIEAVRGKIHDMINDIIEVRFNSIKKEEC